MSLKTRISKAYSVLVGKDLYHSVSGPAVSSIFGAGGDKIDVLKEYNGYAWKCIDIRATTLAAQDLYIEQYIGGKWQQVVNHQFDLVLEGGNGQYDQSELLEAHEKSMCLYGESFWYYSMGQNSQKPMSVYLLDPNYMTVIVSDNRVTGYVYQKNNVHVVLDTDEIEHFRVHDIRNPYRGYGPMQAAGWFVRAARYVVTYSNNFMENNAIPPGVIVAKGDINAKDWELFKQQWAAKYGGIDNAAKTGFVRGTDLSFVKTGLSLGEIDLTAIKQSSLADIMIMFGISKPMMAIFDDVNKASALTARTLFSLLVTSPSLMKLKRKISKDVVRWYGPSFRINSTNPVPEDSDEKLAQYNQGVGRWFTVNEARIAFGKEPLAGSEFDTINPSLAINTVASNQPAKKLGKVTIRTKTTGYSYEMKESFRSKLEDLQNKYEKEIYQATQPILEAQKQMVINQLEPKKVVDANFDPQQESQNLSDAITPILIELANEQGQNATDFVASGSEFVLTPVMQKYIQDSVAKATLGFSQDTQKLIADAVSEGLSSGEGIPDIMKRIDAIYEDMLGIKNHGFRTERLARTETIKSSNQITEAAYKASGVVSKKEWFSNPGACEFCKALDGSTISLGATFVPLHASLEGVNGGTRVNTYEAIDHPPEHPNCRCTLIPVIEK